jgi:hypothetical protein
LDREGELVAADADVVTAGGVAAIEHPVRGSRGHWRLQARTQPPPPHSALGYRTPAEYAAACRHAHLRVACEINRIRSKRTRLQIRGDLS